MYDKVFMSIIFVFCIFVAWFIQRAFFSVEKFHDGPWKMKKYYIICWKCRFLSTENFFNDHWNEISMLCRGKIILIIFYFWNKKNIVLALKEIRPFSIAWCPDRRRKRISSTRSICNRGLTTGTHGRTLRWTIRWTLKLSRSITWLFVLRWVTIFFYKR